MQVRASIIWIGLGLEELTWLWEGMVLTKAM